MKHILAIIFILCFSISTKADIHFWDSPQHGGNSFNQSVPDEKYFRALKATGATWVRLTPSKWKGEGRDFLIGNADEYKGIPAGDLAKLIQCLDAAQAAEVKVVIVPLSLPGARWSQHNDGSVDSRLWNDRQFWNQSIAFWHDLALALKDHPAIVGYNILNEPTTEKGMGLDEHAAPAVRNIWYKKYQNTTHDLIAFYKQVVTSIRTVDANVPIMLDGGWYANAWSFSYWPKLDDDKILYSFHMYEPYAATIGSNMKGKPQPPYPGVKSQLGAEEVVWNKKVMEYYLAKPFEWAATQKIPANRMVVGEFGCVRLWKNCGTYLNDVLGVINSYDAHWAFYSFREDGWDSMDYELSPDVRPGEFYYKMEQGKGDQLKRTPHPLLDIIKAHMKK